MVGPDLPFLQGGGITGALARSLDWAATPVGPPERWPHSLRTVVGVILQSRHPMFLWWGPELVQIYNDAYLPSFGAGKHPAAMGQRGRDCWQEIWPIIWPQIDGVLHEGRSSWNEDHLVPILRNGGIEEVYWTYGYSPVPDDDGGVGGVLVVCTETTSRVVAARRGRTMRSLVERTAGALELDDVLRETVAVLGETAEDAPYVLSYLRPRGGGGMRLAHSVGLADPIRADGVLRATIDAVLDGREPSRLAALEAGADALPGRPWPEPSTGVFVVPFRPSESDAVSGVLAFGLSPRLRFDEAYRHHLHQVAAHVGLTHGRIDALRVRIAAEHERNNLLMQAPVATALLTGPRHVFQLANDLYRRIVGRTDLIGKAYLEAFPQLTDVSAVLDRVYETGEPYCSEEHQVALDRHGDGRLEDCYFKFNLEPLRDASGDVHGMMAVAIDITEQVHARQTLERSHQERDKLVQDLESASRAKDEFLAMLGHELRNPLSPIATALQLMRLRGDKKTSNEQLVIERQVSHLTRLVDDLLDVSKITRGKVELRRELVEASDVIGKAIEIALDLFEQRRHQLVTDVPTSGLCVDGDPVRLAQAVANLLTNAARYTDSGGVIRVTARAEAREDGTGREVVISVRDNGVGLSAELLPHVFELFVQGKRSTDRAQGGLGIGLTLVKNLVGLHGGSVVAMSGGLGKGSEFVMRLPAADRTADAAARRSQARAQVPRSEASKRILVVDDNGDAADSLADVLRVNGHEVQVAYTPVTALEVVDAFRPDVAVLDIGLPVIDGYELASRLRAKAATANCRFIALTGYGQLHDRALSAARGFEHHLVKPVDVDKLSQILAEAGSVRLDDA